MTLYHVDAVGYRRFSGVSIGQGPGGFFCEASPTALIQKGDWCGLGCRHHLSSFRHTVCMLSQCLIDKVSNNFVSFWSDDCPAIETKFDVISSSAPCSCFRVMDISACPTLVYSCCTHCVSKTVCQSTMLAHGLNILLFSFWRIRTWGASTNQYEHAPFTLQAYGMQLQNKNRGQTGMALR